MVTETARTIKRRSWPEWTVLLTLYLFATSLAVRVVVGFTNAELVEVFSEVSGMLVEGGVFTTLIYLVRRGVPEKIADSLDKRLSRSKE